MDGILTSWDLLKIYGIKPAWALLSDWTAAKQTENKQQTNNRGRQSRAQAGLIAYIFSESQLVYLLYNGYGLN